MDGKLILEDNRQTLQRIEYIFAGGRLVAKKIQPITAAGANNGAATITTIHTDFLGSPVAETNAAGTVTRVERYTPYGEPSDQGYDQGPGFTGHSTDAATGLTYAQQRYYDPICGCFLSPDPVQTDPNTGASFNRYNYANNNPYRFTDPDGRESGAGYANSEYQMAQPTCNSTCTNIAGNVADFTPIIGDVKGIVEAYKNPTIITVSAAIVGLVPGAGDIAGKAIKNSDKLLGMAKMVGGFKTLSSGAIQGSVKGDASAIYKSLTKGAAETKSGMMKTKDGTLIGQHTSTKTGVPTIDIKTKDGQVYKIRVIEDKKK